MMSESNPSSVSRRRFLETSAAAGIALGTTQFASAKEAANAANNKVVVGVMGVNSRGSALARGFAREKNCEVKYICDVDSRAVAKGQSRVESVTKKKPEGLTDFRKMLDDKDIDAIVIATPDHWHAPATIMACNAGKHVYVEKPCSHNPQEGEWMIQAARKNKRNVQIGTQRRSDPNYIEAIERIHKGEIGKVHFARATYNNRRPSIGKGKKVAVPDWLDFSLWQGPAPERDYQTNILHYNWHWFWHWGTGELGNNGVHSLDICRWALDADYPSRVVSAGGRYRYSDDQVTPDTHIVTYEFGDKQQSIVWEGLSWSPQSIGGISVHGEGGTVFLTDSGYTIYDMYRKKVSEHNPGDGNHAQNFISSIVSSEKLNAEIEEGHKSTLLCHLGNIAQRTGNVLNTDQKNGHIQDDSAAQQLWSREYRKGWQPQV